MTDFADRPRRIHMYAGPLPPRLTYLAAAAWCLLAAVVILVLWGLS